MRLQEETRPTRLKLDLEGMSCASCAARVEQKLNSIDGVEATVNFATEQATVQRSDETPVAQIIAAVESVGYGARVVEPGAQAGHQHHDEPVNALTRRLVLAVVLTVPVALLAMVPPLRFSGWEWLALALSTPVVFYSGIGFHTAALKNARHFAATMDTLISLGTTAAWLWSTIVLVAGVDDRHLLRGRRRRDDADPARALPRGAARRAAPRRRSALLERGAKEARVLEDGVETLVPVDRARGRRSVRGPSRREDRHRRHRRGRRLSARPVDAYRRIGAGRGRARLGHRRRDGEHLRPPRRPCDEGRRRHCAGADRASRRRGQSGKAPVQRLADRVSAIFVPIVIVLALATLGGWLLGGRISRAAPSRPPSRC